MVVITGIGVVAPGGVCTGPFWDLLTAGRTATRAISHFDATRFRSRIAAECDFDPARHGLTPQEIRRMDRAAQFGVVSAREALTDAGLTAAQLVPERTAVSLGSAVGCTVGLEQEYLVVSNGGRGLLGAPAAPGPRRAGARVPPAARGAAPAPPAPGGPTRLSRTGARPVPSPPGTVPLP